MGRVYQKIFLVSVFVLFLCNSAFAEELKIGTVEIHPWFQITEQYDSNVYIDSSAKDDFVTTLTPGIAIEWPLRDNILKADYHVDVIKFQDQTSQDANNHYFTSQFDINWRDISFYIKEDFRKVFERPSREDVARLKREDNLAGIGTRIDLQRFDLELGYQNFIRDYKAGPGFERFDRTEDIYSIIMSHKTFPKTSLLMEYDFGQVRYDEPDNPDSDYNQLLVGAKGKLTAKSTGTIKVGYQARDYTREGESDYRSGVIYADIVEQFTERDALKISFLRTPYESTYAPNNFYKIDRIAATFGHYFNNKIMGFLLGDYQINSYPRETTEGTETAKRKDNYWSLGSGIRYYFRKWATLTLSYEHIERDSNLSIYDYRENLITLSARAYF